MSLDIEECIGHVRSFGLRLKKEQYELMTMQSEMDGLLQAVQATLDVGSVPPVDTERFSLRSPTASLFGLVPFRQFVPGHSASNGDFLMEARSRSAANSIYMGRLNPSASAILDPPMLANIAGMLDMSVEDVMNRSEKQSSAADAVNDRSSMKKTSTQSLLKSLRFSRSSHSRRPSLGLDLDRDRERATTSSQSLRDFENDKVLEKVYHELIGEKMDREANENYHNRTHSLGRPKTTRASSGGPTDLAPHVEINVSSDENTELLMSESTRRKNRSQAPSLTEQKMFESDNNLKIHGSNVDSSEAELSIERGPTVINKDLARLKTSGNDSHRSNSVVSVKFQAPPSVKPSECESLNSAPKIPSRKADSVMSTASTRASTHNMPLQNLRNKIVRFLYVPSFTEFGFNLANDKGALKSKSSLTARETSNQEGFHPYSAGLVYWGMLMFLIHLLVLYEAPVIAAFETRVHSSDLSIVLTAFFVIDITVQFFSLRIVDGVVEPSILDARWAYLRSGLLLDVLATIPFDIILKKSLRHSEACILIRLLYTRNLARISKTNAYLMKFSRWIQRTFRVGVSFMRIFLLGGILITFLHIHGCLVFFLGKVTGFTGDSWRKVNYLFQEEVNNQYIWSLFVATANTFPVTGFQPTDPIEQVIGILLAIIGAVLYACLVGTISSFSFGLDSSGRKYKEKIDEVNEYMTYRNLSDNIKKKVRDYFEMKYKGKFFDEEAILKEMNDSLRLEIAVHNCQDLIAKVPFLRREMNDGRDEVFMGRIARALRPKYFVKGDIIFEQGWVGNEMYFILKGSLSIIVNQKVVGNLIDGAFFGEVALLGEVPRTATIKASTNTVLYCLERQDFVTIIADYQDMAMRIKQVYEERMVKVKKENEEKLQQNQTKAGDAAPPGVPKVMATAPLQQ